MSSNALDAVTSWLRCPDCASDLTAEAHRLVCDTGHSFDIAKQGYVNLLGRSQPDNADTAPMVAAREQFLSAGYYAPLTREVRHAITGASRVVEVGAGTAHHLAGSLSSDAYGLATDVSVAACRKAARQHPRIASVVADTWAGLPLKDHSVDAVLCIFAPRNVSEFSRILVPDGLVVVVIPEPDHLAELRHANELLIVEEAKAEKLAAAFAEFRPVSSQVISGEIALDDDAATAVVSMGPNAFHHRGPVHAVRTHFSVRVSCFGVRG